VHVVDTARGPITERDEMMLVPAKVGIEPPTTAKAPGLQRSVLVGSLAEIAA